MRSDGSSMRPKALVLGLLTLSFGALFLSGCGQGGGDGLSKEMVDVSNKSDQIIKSANGNWDSLSPEDKQYLIKEVGSGDEYNAKMYFSAKSGTLKQGAPRTPGSPPAAPK